MSKNYPDTIPSVYASDDALADAYKRGWNHGHGFACHNVPRLGDKLRTDSMGRVTVDAGNIREVHADQCYAAESGSRDYSPFEFTASEFNEPGDEPEEGPSSESLWEAFEEGTNDSIAADLAEYDDEDYGIEAEADEEYDEEAESD
jgi:hypothetical protein